MAAVRRLVAPVLFGIVGMAILIGLGVWQLQRLAWKEAILAEIAARIGADPVDIPAQPDPRRDSYLPVRAMGRVDADPISVLASRKQVGAGYRIVTAFETGGRRVLLDLGFIPDSAGQAPPMTGSVEVVGNLAWPDEVDGFTPEPDPVRNIWFARDVPRMAAALNTEPVLIVARQTSVVSAIEPLPVDTGGIPNDHLMYAVTWFSLAAVWVGMTVLLVWRITHRSD